MGLDIKRSPTNKTYHDYDHTDGKHYYVSISKERILWCGTFFGYAYLPLVCNGDYNYRLMDVPEEFYKVYKPTCIYADVAEQVICWKLGIPYDHDPKEFVWNETTQRWRRLKKTWESFCPGHGRYIYSEITDEI